jgi:hypothetical protein
LARRRGAASSTLVTATATRYQDALNESHKAVLRMPGLAALRYGYLTLASVAAQQNYAVPHEGVARIDRVWDPTNRRKLDYLTLDQVREDNPSAIQGTPYAYAPMGYVEAFTQPSNASEIFVKSTAAGDTTQTAYIEGFITGGYYRTASVVLTGTTAVTLSATITSFIHITKFYLSATAVGTVTINEDSGAGTELSRITIGRTRARYYGLVLEPVPSAVITYSLDVLREIPDMSVATDEPLLPEDFHDLLIDMAELKELRKQDDPARYGLLTGQVTQAKKDLISFCVNHPDWRPQWADQGVQTMGSQLGAFYPAGT